MVRVQFLYNELKGEVFVTLLLTFVPLETAKVIVCTILCTLLNPVWQQL